MILGPDGKVKLDDNAKGLMNHLADLLKDAIDADDKSGVDFASTHDAAAQVEFMLREVAK